MPMQYTAIFHCCKNDIFQVTKCYIVLIFAQNIDCGYTLEPTHCGGSNVYPQSMFQSKNKKTNVYLCKPTFYYVKVGCKGLFITRTGYHYEQAFSCRSSNELCHETICVHNFTHNISQFLIKS